MDVREAFVRAVEDLGSRISAISPDRWNLPTPCEQWSVRDVVRHLVEEDLRMQPLRAGETIEYVGARFEGDLLGDEPRQAWLDASLKAVAAVRALDDVQGTVHLSSGNSTASAISR